MTFTKTGKIEREAGFWWGKQRAEIKSIILDIMFQKTVRTISGHIE